jgi:NADH-quinone oxidoreductase subunit A
MEQNSDTLLLWPFILYAAAVVLLVAGMLFVSYFLGEKHKERATNKSYESGIAATGTTRLRFPVHFYIVAMFFVIFDLETAIIIAWAISIRETGWTGYLAVVIFAVILLVVLVYEWKTGALDFGPSGKKILKAYHKKLEKKNANEVVDK